MWNEQTVVLLINAGIAGVFAVFAIVMVKYFLEFLKGEREQRDVIMSRALKSQTELLVQMAKLTQIIEHIRADIDCEKREREKTRPRKPAPAD